jgi:hypothetical protein
MCKIGGILDAIGTLVAVLSIFLAAMGQSIANGAYSSSLHDTDTLLDAERNGGRSTLSDVNRQETNKRVFRIWSYLDEERFNRTIIDSQPLWVFGAAGAILIAVGKILQTYGVDFQARLQNSDRRMNVHEIVLSSETPFELHYFGDKPMIPSSTNHPKGVTLVLKGATVVEIKR